MREILEELQRRKDAKEDLCDSCDATGLYWGKVCVDCLGQGVLLTKAEYETILTAAHRADDAILDQQMFDLD